MRHTEFPECVGDPATKGPRSVQFPFFITGCYISFLTWGNQCIQCKKQSTTEKLVLTNKGIKPPLKILAYFPIISITKNAYYGKHQTLYWEHFLFFTDIFRFRILQPYQGLSILIYLCHPGENDWWPIATGKLLKYWKCIWAPAYHWHIESLELIGMNSIDLYTGMCLFTL